MTRSSGRGRVVARHASWLCIVDAVTKDTINKILVLVNEKNIREKNESGPGLDLVQPQGPVHSPPRPGPTKSGPVHPLTGPDPRTYGVGPVRTWVREGQDRTPDSLVITYIDLEQCKNSSVSLF